MTFHKNPHLHRRHDAVGDLIEKLEKRQGGILFPGGGGSAPAGGATTTDAATTQPAATTRPAATTDRTTAPTTAAAPDPTTSAAAHTSPTTTARAAVTSATDRSVVRVTSTSTSGRSLASAFSISGLSSGTLTGLLSTASISASASAASENGGGSGPSAGTVVGIVAGALVGLIFVSAVVGYVFRTKWGNRSGEDEDKYGDMLGKTRDDFRRDSVMLPAGNGSDIGSDRGEKYNDMASVAGHSTLGRSNTYASNAYLHPGMSAAPPLPPGMSFQPGQVINPAFYGMPPVSRALSPGPIMPPQRALSPGPMFPGYGPPPPDFSYGMPPPPGAFYHPPGSPAPGQHGFGQNLNRAPSVPPMHMMRSASPGAQGMMLPNGRPLSPLRVPNEIPSRTGTPENNNVQQYFHRGHDSGSVALHDGPLDHMTSTGGQRGLDGELSRGQGAQGNGVTAQQRAKRTLSVRNGGLDDYGHQGQYGKQRPMSSSMDDDAYGGM